MHPLEHVAARLAACVWFCAGTLNLPTVEHIVVSDFLTAAVQDEDQDLLVEICKAAPRLRGRRTGQVHAWRHLSNLALDSTAARVSRISCKRSGVGSVSLVLVRKLNPRKALSATMAP